MLSFGMEGRPPDLAKANGHGHEDGRLSFKEFEKVMLLSSLFPSFARPISGQRKAYRQDHVKADVAG